MTFKQLLNNYTALKIRTLAIFVAVPTATFNANFQNSKKNVVSHTIFAQIGILLSTVYSHTAYSLLFALTKIRKTIFILLC